MQRSVSLSDTAGLREMGLFGFSGIRGVSVSEQTSLSLSVLWACVRILGDAVAQLPLSIIEDGTKRKATDHPIYMLLALRPNSYQTSATFRRYIDGCVRLWGNGYARIQRNGSYRPIALHPKHPADVSIIDRRKEEGLVYYQMDGELVPAYDVLHFVGSVICANGIEGRRVVSVAAEMLGMQIANQREMANFYQDGANLQYALKHPGKLSDPAANRLSGTFDQKYTGVGKRRVIVLEEGMGIESIGLPPGDAKFIETAKLGALDICRFFGVPPHMVAELDRATFSNIEEQGIGFLVQTLTPSLVNYEQEYRLKLLREVEIPRFVIKHNTNALMRAKAADRAAFYAQMRQNGLLNADEIRDLEDLPEQPDGQGKHYLVNGNMISVATAALQQPGANNQQTQPAA